MQRQLTLNTWIEQNRTQTFFFINFLFENQGEEGTKIMILKIIQKDKNFAFAGHKRFEFGPFCGYHDSKEDTLASFDVKVAATCLMVHCSANSTACSCSKIVVKWSGTIVAVFDNAVLGWDCFFHWNVIICRCDRDQKSQHWNDFHVLDFCDLVFDMSEKDLEDLILRIFSVRLI